MKILSGLYIRSGRKLDLINRLLSKLLNLWIREVKATIIKSNSRIRERKRQSNSKLNRKKKKYKDNKELMN